MITKSITMQLTINHRYFCCSCGYEYFYTSEDKDNRKYKLIKRLHYKKCDGECLEPENPQTFRMRARSANGQEKIMKCYNTDIDLKN